MTPPPVLVLDAVVVGAGPSGLGASLALSGYRAHCVPNGDLEDQPDLRDALAERVRRRGTAGGGGDGSGSGGGGSFRVTLEEAVALGRGLRGRSNNPLALLFDHLQHPGVDVGRAAPSCLELRRDPRTRELRHRVIDPAPFGGSWHGMHADVVTLSPGRWMEFPGFPLAEFLADAGGSEPGSGDPAAAAEAAAGRRQPRGVVAAYYAAAAERFDVARHRVAADVISAERAAAIASDGTARASGGGAEGDWIVTIGSAAGDGPAAPRRTLRARNLVLCTGTHGVPRELGIPGEELDFVVHRSTHLPVEINEFRRSESSPGPVPIVFVVGAGLSASDCVVHLLGKGVFVHHVFRGAPQETKVYKMFGATPRGPSKSGSCYPEYEALTDAMAASRGRAGEGGDPDGRGDVPLMGGRYTPWPFTELRAVRPDGRCELRTTATERARGNAASRGPGEGEPDRPGGPTAAPGERDAVVRADAVAVLIGSGPDLSFLSPAVRAALDSRPPSDYNAAGVKSTHPVVVDVDPFTMESTAVPGLFATGPLRGDNFARFAIHDGQGVVAGVLRNLEKRAESAPRKAPGS